MRVVGVGDPAEVALEVREVGGQDARGDEGCHDVSVERDSRRHRTVPPDLAAEPEVRAPGLLKNDHICTTQFSQDELFGTGRRPGPQPNVAHVDLLPLRSRRGPCRQPRGRRAPHAPAVEMTRRQKEARRAMERRIAAQSAAQSKQSVPESSFWEKFRTGLATMRTNLSKAPTRVLSASAVALLVFWIPVAWITVDHLVTPLILDVRGVTVEAFVDQRFYGRSSHTLDVQTLEGPQFSTTLEHWPRGLEVGDLFNLTYDPQQPNRATAEDAPWIDATVIQFLFLALLILPLGLLLVPIALELARRGWSRATSRRGADSTDAPGTRPRDMQRAYPAAVRYLRSNTETQPAIMTFAVFVLIPALLVLGSGTLAVVQVAEAAALHQRGGSGTAIVDRTNTVSGWGERVEIHFVAPAEPRVRPVRTTVTNLADVHFEGERIKIVYDPEHPENAVEAGAVAWGWSEWNAIFFFVASAAFGAVSFPAVVPRLGRAVRRDQPTIG
ncbi:hypothetical protein [Promicromonospora sp. NPDC023987]|uniref:hypothetical protein n=1 Tax=Promicromonospora sp. NPDC023987 TaxID=3155360 RepID=UPI0033DEDFA9